MTTLLVATTNKGKLREIREIMAGEPYDIISLDDALRLGYISEIPEVIEDGDTFEHNAIKKATEVMRYANVAVLADDSGLEIDFLGGQPGVHSAYYMGADTPYTQRNARIVEMMRGIGAGGRAARFVCVIAIAFTDGRTLTARGVCEGVIAQKAAGCEGFGYDPIFYVPSLGKTFAEMNIAEKNAISHRATALREIRQVLV